MVMFETPLGSPNTASAYWSWLIGRAFIPAPVSCCKAVCRHFLGEKIGERGFETAGAVDLEHPL